MQPISFILVVTIAASKLKAPEDDKGFSVRRRLFHSTGFAKSLAEHHSALQLAWVSEAGLKLSCTNGKPGAGVFFFFLGLPLQDGHIKQNQQVWETLDLPCQVNYDINGS